MQEAVASITGDTSLPFLQAEIIGFILTLRTQIVLVRPITGRGRDEYKALPFMLGQRKAAVFSGLHYVQSVGYTDTCQ